MLAPFKKRSSFLIRLLFSSVQESGPNRHRTNRMHVIYIPIAGWSKPAHEYLRGCACALCFEERKAYIRTYFVSPIV